MYSLLKITSMIATGAFGALALLTKYKDDKGKMTKWGKVALSGIIISSVISLSLYVLETSKARAAAEKAKAEAEATTKTLQSIQSNAQTTADQQKKSLEETNILKLGLEKTLEQQRLNLNRSDYIAKGMENSLIGQQLVLGGNKKILSGVTNTVNEQKRQLEKLVRLDFARLQLAGIQLSVTSRNKVAYQKIKEIFSEALVVELDDRRVLPTYLKPCFEDNPTSSQCKLEIEKTPKGKVTARAVSPFGFGAMEGPTSFVIASDEATWTKIEKIVLTTVFRQLEILNDSGVLLLPLNDGALIRSISLLQGKFELKLEDPKIKLDQLYNSRVSFKMIGDREDLPLSIHIKSTDPNALLDQTFAIKWLQRDDPNQVLFEDGLTGSRGFSPENISEPYPLKVTFPNM